MRNVFLVCFCLLFALPVAAMEIAGVSVPDSIKTDDGVTLSLNGAGIRTKLFFDIYIAQLYLEKPATETKDVLAADNHKRVIMHFLYEKVEKAKVVEVWNEGFLSNTNPEQLAELKGRINQFNAMFTDVKKDDVVILDYVPGSGTKVIVAGAEKGVIQGKDFNDALLSIWLGESPISKDLKAKLLGSAK